MNRAGRQSGALVKSAMLWLTIAVMLASVYGASLAVSKDQHPRVLFAAAEPAHIVATSTDYRIETADR